jgi:hypothetical protein
MSFLANGKQGKKTPEKEKCVHLPLCFQKQMMSASKASSNFGNLLFPPEDKQTNKANKIISQFYEIFNLMTFIFNSLSLYSLSL